MRAFSVSSALAAFSLAAPSCLMAAEETVPHFVSGGDLFWKTLVVLVCIVLFLLALGILGRKFLAGQTFGQGAIKLIGGLALGPRERIVLVETGEDLLVIGIVPGQIRTLHRMKKQPDASPCENDPSPQSANSFTRALANAIRHLRTPHEKT
ncbi:MAG: flagellar biosynthetic protein FliO [Betaproteobacteria bacterium]|nr:flagellar biosynthetic protein FliO [Betaproteobacteria bacterium]